jgi:hypothetical protein
MEKYKQTTLCIRIETESDYGLITKDNKPLEFETEQGGKWASAIEAKKSMISWSIIRAEVTNADK